MKNQVKRQAISKKTRFEVFKRDQFTCQFCGKSAPDCILEIDHLKPVSKGGDNSLLNLLASCYDCNRGKSGNEISDDSVIKKQLNQLALLEQKRQQLELLAKWKDGLNKVDSQYIKFYEKLFKKLSKIDFTLNEFGRGNIAKLRKKFSDEEIIDAAETSFRQYYHFPDAAKERSEQWNKSFNYIARILEVRKRTKESPEMADLYYCRAILKNKVTYKPDWQIMNYLKNLLENRHSIEDIKDAARSCYNWNSFKKYFGE
tara:strand:- start:1014 stop:1787 length:774 start_codon:yes stop_codon:yes gene_type:complete